MGFFKFTNALSDFVRIKWKDSPKVYFVVGIDYLSFDQIYHLRDYAYLVRICIDQQILMC